MPNDAPPLTQLPPRSGGWRQTIWATLGLLMFAGILVAMMVYTGPALLTDWQVHASAQPAEHGHVVKGSCSTRLVFAICDVTVENRDPSGTVTRDMNYIFTDIHFGSYRAGVMLDPARPGLITTDLGLDHLWNRTITFAVATAVLLTFVLLPMLAFVRNRRGGAGLSRPR